MTVEVAVGVGVKEGVRLGGANWVGVASMVWVGGPAVKEGSMVRIPPVTVGKTGTVTVASRVGVGVRPWLGPLQVNAKTPTQ